MPAKFKLCLTFDGNDELRDDWEYLGTALIKHVEGSLNGQESVWLLFLTDTFEENREVVMIIKGHDINFPGELVLRTVIDSDWKISSIIEAAELRWWDRSSVSSTCFWFGSLSLFFWSE